MGNYATEEDKSLHLNEPNQDNAQMPIPQVILDLIKLAFERTMTTYQILIHR